MVEETTAQIERAIEIAMRAETKADLGLTHVHEIRRDIANLDRKNTNQHIENQQQISKNFDRVHVRIDALAGRWVGIGGFIIMGLIALVGYLLVEGVPWVMR